MPEPGKYVRRTLVEQVITAEEARADRAGWDPDLCEDAGDGTFVLYTRGEFGHRIAPVTYEPLRPGS